MISRDVMQPRGRGRTANWTLVNQTKQAYVNIQDMSHMTFVTSVQPLSTGTLLQLANPVA